MDLIKELNKEALQKETANVPRAYSGVRGHCHCQEARRH